MKIALLLLTERTEEVDKFVGSVGRAPHWKLGSDPLPPVILPRLAGLRMPAVRNFPVSLNYTFSRPKWSTYYNRQTIVAVSWVDDNSLITIIVSLE